MNNNWDILAKKTEQFGINLTENQILQFKEYWKFLDEYNQHTNLVSSTEQNIVVIKHFLDSLSIGLLKNELNWSEKKTIIDIGIGGGFPGVPIIIANPEWKLIAVDSVGKKTKFIELLKNNLGLQGRITVLNARAEELARDENYREKSDIVVARAVSQLNVLAEYCLPFVKAGGQFVSYKAKSAQEELNEAENAVKILGGNVEKVVHYSLETDETLDRNLILINKIKNTPAKYPRKAGLPKKSPLK